MDKTDNFCVIFSCNQDGDHEKQKESFRVKSYVLMPARTMMFFWDVIPCRHVRSYRHFGETYCRYFQDLGFSETLVSAYKSRS